MPVRGEHSYARGHGIFLGCLRAAGVGALAAALETIWDCGLGGRAGNSDRAGLRRPAGHRPIATIARELQSAMVFALDRWRRRSKTEPDRAGAHWPSQGLGQNRDSAGAEKCGRATGTPARGQLSHLQGADLVRRNAGKRL